MATPEFTQISAESVHRSAADVMVPTLLELPMNGWPQQTTELLSPDPENNETISSARQLGHENSTVNTKVLPNPIVPPSTTFIATTDTTLSNFQDDNLTSTEEHNFLSTPKTSLPSSSDVGVCEDYATLTSDNESTPCEKPVKDLALEILGIIERYGHGAVEVAGKTKFLPLVKRCIQKNVPVNMVLPAFPCVSEFDFYPFSSFVCIQRLLSKS